MILLTGIFRTSSLLIVFSPNPKNLEKGSLTVYHTTNPCLTYAIAYLSFLRQIIVPLYYFGAAHFFPAKKVPRETKIPAIFDWYFYKFNDSLQRMPRRYAGFTGKRLGGLFRLFNPNYISFPVIERKHCTIDLLRDSAKLLNRWM